MPDIRLIDCGNYVVIMRCPRCREPQEVFVGIQTRLTVDLENATLRPVLKAKAVDHMCGQGSLLDHENVVDADTGDLFTPAA